MKTIVLCGGGTAGHVMPNVALIPELKKHFERIVYLGTPNGVEKDIVSKIKGVEFREISAPRFIRKLTFKNFCIPCQLLKSISKAKKILKEVNPNIIFSKGGFASIPVCLAGKSLKTPILTHESDISLGLANKIISLFAKYTLTSFEKTSKNRKNFIFTGSPLREQIFKGDKTNLKLDFDKNKKNILVTGGSLGAKAINDFITYYLDKLTLKYNIIHITGRGKLKINNTKGYFPIEYVEHIEDYFAKADYVISRSGANTLFELLALNKPTIFIPLPKNESRGDQILNARYFYNKNMCNVILQENLNINNFIKTLNDLKLREKELKDNMKKLNLENSNEKIVDLIVKNCK